MLTLLLVCFSHFHKYPTCLLTWRPQVPEPGGLVAFPGDCSHGGMPITGGTRYIIAAFLYVLDWYPSWSISTLELRSGGVYLCTEPNDRAKGGAKETFGIQAPTSRVDGLIKGSS
jgi:hypothetical protein